MNTFTFTCTSKGSQYTAEVATPDCQTEAQAVQKAMEAGNVLRVEDQNQRVIFPVQK